MPLLQLIVQALHMLIAKIAGPAPARRRQRGEQAAKLPGDLIAGLDGEGILGLYQAVAPLAVHGNPRREIMDLINYKDIEP